MMKLLKEAINWLSRFDGIFALIVAPLTAILTLTYAILSQLHVFLSWGLDRIDTAVSGVTIPVLGNQLGSVATDFWVTVNTFFPLDLVFELTVVLLGLKVTFATVRIIKSWIPTIG